MDISTLLHKFSRKYRTEVNRKYSRKLFGYRILVNDVPGLLEKQLHQMKVDMSYLSIKGSIGHGNTTHNPWVAIFDNRISTGATNGFYVALLISDDFEDLYLTLDHSSTNLAKTLIEGNKVQIYSLNNDLKGFTKGRLPERSLVKINQYLSTNKGRKYEEAVIYYRKYDLLNLDKEDFYYYLEVVLRFYQECASALAEQQTLSTDVLSIDLLLDDLASANLYFNSELVRRLVYLLLSKPFVLLTGLTGSGKSKLAQAFVKWLTGGDKQYRFIPVGSDWTNREPLLGYPNALEAGQYVKPDNGVLDLLIDAAANPGLPYFLILDEMNLSHVERYFADFLSAMESGESIPIHSAPEGLTAQDGTRIPAEIKLNPNLFIIGTVNIDETTYMFSPKVLDRAGVLEFRVTGDDMKSFFENPKRAAFTDFEGNGSSMAPDFVAKASSIADDIPGRDLISQELLRFFHELVKVGAEFGYRTASEILQYAGKVNLLNNGDESWTTDMVIDTAIVQKLLPKIHGSRRKVAPVLEELAALCLDTPEHLDLAASEHNRLKKDSGAQIKYPISLEKICRMYDRAIFDGFTSFAEA